MVKNNYAYYLPHLLQPDPVFGLKKNFLTKKPKAESKIIPMAIS
jgi:hypothetical protein